MLEFTMFQEKCLPGPVRSTRFAIDCSSPEVGDRGCPGFKSLLDRCLIGRGILLPVSLPVLSFSCSLALFSSSWFLSKFPILLDLVNIVGCFGVSLSLAALLWFITSLLLGALVSNFLSICGLFVSFLGVFPLLPHCVLGVAVLMIPVWIASVIFSFLI